ncbi:hypothetical protein V8E54_007349 [Elaphomyces granulatus]
MTIPPDQYGQVGGFPMSDPVSACPWTLESCEFSPFVDLSPTSPVSPEQSVVDRRSQPRLDSSQLESADISSISPGGNSKNQGDRFFCDVQGCAMSSKPFKRKFDRDRHKREQHSFDIGGYMCGLCQNRNFRKERMIKHLRAAHGMPEGATPEECLCMDSTIVLFTSRLELDRYLEVHKIQGTHQALKSNISSPNHMQDPRITKKHSFNAESRSQLKRSKSSTGQYQWTRNTNSGTIMCSEIEVRNINTLEILNMVTLDEFETWYYKKEHNRLQITYNLSSNTIKVRGRSGVIQDAKTKLEGWTKLVKDQILADFNACPSDNRSTAHSLSFKSGLSASQTDERVENPIFPVSTEDDKDALETWFLLLPELSSVLGPALGKDYSAALVRQKSPDGMVPIIRIQSASGQSTAIRIRLREQINKICSIHGRQSLQLQFSRGILRRLVGQSQVVDDEANENMIFPHHRRYWHNPGMGASIGLEDYNISATLGGYILIDGHIFILTVDHIFDNAETTTVVSPSVPDVDNLQMDLEQTIRDIVAAINGNWGKDRNEVPLTDIMDLYQLQVDLKRFQQYRKELARQPRDFKLGRLRKRCVQLAKTACGDYTRPAPVEALEHRMDWSILEVVGSRRGVNKYRCPFEYFTTGNWNDQWEELHPLGVGPLCKTTCELEPNMAVKYVGQGSGPQFGHISAAPVSVTLNGENSSEWAIILQPESQQIFTTYFGDSGSWVLRQSDNALVGLLWGWVDGHLVFTPIKDVFSDIKSALNADIICLPVASDSNSLHSNALQICCLSENPRQSKTYFRRYPSEIENPIEVDPDPVRVTDPTRSQPSNSPVSESCYSIPSPESDASVSSPPELSTSSPSSSALSPREHEFEGAHFAEPNSSEPAILNSDDDVDNLPITEDAIIKTSLDFILQGPSAKLSARKHAIGMGGVP